MTKSLEQIVYRTNVELDAAIHFNISKIYLKTLSRTSARQSIHNNNSLKVLWKSEFNISNLFNKITYVIYLPFPTDYFIRTQIIANQIAVS